MNTLKWIPSKEASPEPGSTVLIWIRSEEYGDRFGIVDGVDSSKGWYIGPICECDWEIVEPSHWTYIHPPTSPPA